MEANRAMILETFIASLRANAPVFQGRVAGAAEFYAGLRNYNTSLPMPAAYVLPLGQEAEPNDLQAGGIVQWVHKTIGIAVELDAQSDRRGQTPTMSFDEIEAQIMASCLNLVVDRCRMSRGTAFAGARYLDLDRARLWYQWEFVIDWQINSVDDGVADPCDTAPALNPIELDIHLQPIEDHPESAIGDIIELETGC
jgi:hypothetical protein